jgi:hypothetical protein
MSPPIPSIIITVVTMPAAVTTVIGALSMPFSVATDARKVLFEQPNDPHADVLGL